MAAIAFALIIYGIPALWLILFFGALIRELLKKGN